MFRKSFADSGSSDIKSDGHTLTFLANSGTEMTNGYTVDLSTLKVPVSDGSLKLVKDLKDTDKLTVPLLVDHYPSVDHQAGYISKVWLEDNGLMATAKLSDVEEGKTVQQLAKDGALTNSFSITVESLNLPGKDGVIHEAELIEISVVYRGADSKAAFMSLNGREQPMDKTKIKLNLDEVREKLMEFNLTQEEADDLTDKIKAAMQSALTDIAKAVSDSTESEDEDNDEGDDGDEGEPKGGEDPQPPQQSSNNRKGSKVSDPTIIINKANTGVQGGSIAKVASDRKTYLDSDKAFNDYAKFIYEHPTAAHAKEVTAEWAKFAREQLNEHASFGIDSDSVGSLIPKSVVTTIEDVLNTRGSGLWDLFNKTGLTVTPTLGMNDIGLDGDEGRAHGYPVSAYGTEKLEETIRIKTRTFAADYVYKYITLNKGDLRRTQDPGAMLKYVLQELPNRVIQTSERAAILNQADPSKHDWPDMAMFKSIIDDSNETAAIAGNKTIPGSMFALKRAPKAGETPVESFRRAAGMIKASGAKVLVTTSEMAAELEFSKDNDGRFLLPLGSNVAAAVGVDRIITPEWYLDRDTKVAMGVILVPGQYSIFGDNSIEAFTNFKLSTNTQEYLQEFYTGGGLRTIKSAVVIPPATSVNPNSLSERIANTTQTPVESENEPQGTPQGEPQGGNAETENGEGNPTE